MNTEAKPKQYSVLRNSLPALIVGILLFGVLAGYLYTGCKPVWQFDTLEAHARSVITGAQLQNWATNFIANEPTNPYALYRLAELGTNFPAQLRNLAPRVGPNVALYNGGNDERPPSVRIWWGSGFLGSTGFEIGPTNFVGRGRQWQQPGVYLFKNP
jgi:hypothetical protein